MHVPTDFGSFVIYGASALVLGFIYYKTDHFEINAGIHMLNNFIGWLAIIGLLG